MLGRQQHHAGQLTPVDVSGLSTITPTFATAQADCVFTWAERVYPVYFSPGSALSSTLDIYYYRYSPSTNAYLGISMSEVHLLYAGPASENSVLDLGALSGWLPISGCQ